MTGIPENPVSISEGQTATAPTPPALTGYDFAEWYTEATATNPYDFSQVVTANIDLYAKWTIQVFTVTYDVNKPTGATAEVTGMPNPVMINYNLTTAAPRPAPALEGYTFEGWYTEQATTTEFAFTTPITTNIDLYAKWSQNFIVTFNTQGGSNIDSQTLTGTIKRATRPSMNPSRPPLYTFKGWFTTATGTTEFSFDQDITAPRTTVYAQWTRNTYITFNYNFGEMPATATRTTDQEGKVSPPDLSSQRDAAYTMIGWFKTIGGSDKIDDFATEVFNENITLYAKWGFRPSTKAELVAEINRAITAATPSPNLNYIDTSLINDMSNLFENKRSFNGDVSSWNVSKVENMSLMFYFATAFNQNISSWNVAKVTNMNSMFRNASAFNQNISSWNVSLVENMENMFQEASGFNQNISSWNVSLVENMSSMFRLTTFNQNISSWNVSLVKNMSYMFNSAWGFNQNISSWNVVKVTDMSSMFEFAIAFNGDISNWRPTALTNMSNMFKNASAFTQNINSWNIASSVDKTDAFLNSGLAENLPSWATP